MTPKRELLPHGHTRNHSLRGVAGVVGSLGGPDDDPPVLAASGHVGAVGRHEQRRDGARVRGDPQALLSL